MRNDKVVAIFLLCNLNSCRVLCPWLQQRNIRDNYGSAFVPSLKRADDSKSKKPIQICINKHSFIAQTSNCLHIKLAQHNISLYNRPWISIKNELVMSVLLRIYIKRWWWKQQEIFLLNEFKWYSRNSCNNELWLRIVLQRR